jgi:voltage-gated potassium channel
MTVTHQARWSRLTEIPLVAIAAIFTVAYAWDIIGDLQGRAREIADIVIWVTWGAFVVDFVVKLVLAERRMKWFFAHFVDFLLVALPFLRPLRLLRVFTLVSVVQRIFGKALRGRVAVYVVGSSLMLVFLAALAILEAERNAPGARITNFGDAIWWSFETITTVGYGDYEPITVEGRLVAVALMISGIALLGVITATLAAWLVAQVSVVEDTEQELTRAEIAELGRSIAELRDELARSRENSVPQAPLRE